MEDILANSKGLFSSSLDSIKNRDVLKQIETATINQLIKRLTKIGNETTFINSLIAVKETQHFFNSLVIRVLRLIVKHVMVNKINHLYVNETHLLKIKNIINDSPVVYVPTHRSYGDFILMAFITYHYDMEIPCVAAGMDFKHMSVTGELLRRCKAFFIKRSFGDDVDYKFAFQTYVKTLMMYGISPVEFFIEGTRSRTGKSLSPKYGFLSMVLEIFFNGDIPDITFVPVNISYDRYMEEKLFACENLGIPKPKESTIRLFKSLFAMNSNYGSIHIKFGDPISFKNCLPSNFTFEKRSKEDELQIVRNLAFTIVKKQQELQTFGVFNLLAIIINHYIHYTGKNVITLDVVRDEIEKLSNYFECFGSPVFFETSHDLLESILMHRDLLLLHDDSIIFINDWEPLSYEPEKMMGYSLNSSTISKSMPSIMLQLYINPCIQVFINASYIMTILEDGNIKSKDLLLDTFHYLQLVFQYEFVQDISLQYELFTDALNKLKECDCIAEYNNKITIKSNLEMRHFLRALLWPFITGYYSLYQSMCKINYNKLETGNLVKVLQGLTENLVSEGDLHPYVLSLNLISNAKESFSSLNIFNCNNKYLEMDHEKSKTFDIIIGPLAKHLNLHPVVSEQGILKSKI